MKKKHVETKIEDHISEVLNSKSNVRWENNGAGRVGFFELGDNSYRIKIESVNIRELVPLMTDQVIKTFVFKFAKKNENDEFVMNLVKDNQYQFKVFGTLKSEIIEFIKKEDPDILFFVGDEERKGLYSKLLGLAEMSYREKYTLREIKYDEDYLYFMIKLNLTGEIKRIESSKEISKLLK